MSIKLVFMFFASALYSGMSEEKVREAGELFNTLTEQGYRAFLVLCHQPLCRLNSIQRRVFYNYYTTSIMDGMRKFQDDVDGFNEEFGDFGFFLKPDANEVLSRFLDESFVMGRSQVGPHMIFMNHDNKFIIVSKMPEGEPNFVGFEKTDDYGRIVVAPLSKTNIDQAKMKLVIPD